MAKRQLGKPNPVYAPGGVMLSNLGVYFESDINVGNTKYCPPHQLKKKIIKLPRCQKASL